MTMQHKGDFLFPSIRLFTIYSMGFIDFTFFHLFHGFHWFYFFSFIPWVSLILLFFIYSMGFIDFSFFHLFHGFHWFEICFQFPKRKQKDLFITLFCPMGYFTSFIKLRSSFLFRSILSTAELWKNFWWISECVAMKHILQTILIRNTIHYIFFQLKLFPLCDFAQKYIKKHFYIFRYI